MGFAELYEKQKRLQERAERFPSGSFRIEYEERPKETDAGGGETRKDIYGTFTEETLLSRFTEKSKEEIIRRGTAREKAALRLADFEAGQIMGLKKILTAGETKKLIESAEDLGEGYEEYLIYISEFDTLTKYEKELRSVYSTTQTEEAELVMLVNEWDELQTEANLLTLAQFDDKKWKALTREEKKEYMRKFLQVYPENYEPEPGKAVCIVNREGAESLFYYDEEEEFIKVNIEGEGRLYGKILYRAERVRNTLSILKAAVNAVADYIERKGGADLLIPFGVENILRETWSESYVQLIVRDKMYLRSSLIEIYSDGWNVFEEDVPKAVIPDYYETEENKAARKIYDRIIARHSRTEDKDRKKK